MLYFTHKGNSTFQVRIFDFGGIENSYQLRDPEEPPYIRTGNYEIAKCINIPPSASARAVAAKVKSKWPFFVMDLTARMMSSRLLPNVPHLSHFTGQRHPLILTHGDIQVEATYTRYSGKRDGSFGVILEDGRTLLHCATSSQVAWVTSRLCSGSSVHSKCCWVDFCDPRCTLVDEIDSHGVAIAIQMLETAVTGVAGSSRIEGIH
ncbi:hypothetical protein HN873_025422 [Arachis hypogaea]